MAESRIDELRKRLERDPESRLFAQLAEELRKDGELEEAIGIARAGLERHPNYPSARLTLGRALLDSGDPAGAREQLDAAVSGAPDNILASRLLGEALETLGDLGSALSQYQTTLQMAPGDGHVEARIKAIQVRLGAPEGDPGPAETPDVTEPTAAVKTPLGADSEGAEELPPTIRIRMPGDAPRPGRAPLPPVPSKGTGETTLPARPGASEPARESGTEGPETESEISGADLPATLPMPGAEPLPPPEGPVPEPDLERERAPEAEAEAEAAPDPGTESEVADPGTIAPDLAPTLPRSRAAEFAAVDESLPPTLPPGVITAVEDAGLAEGTPPPSEASVAEPAMAEAPVAEVTAEGPVEPPEPTEDDDVAQAPAADEAPPLSSATLAELYFEQGLLERAVEVYRQVLEEEPVNETARVRLAEIEKMVAAGAEDLQVPTPDDAGDPAARRRALERTIERLEALLEIVRRR